MLILVQLEKSLSSAQVNVKMINTGCMLQVKIKFRLKYFEIEVDSLFPLSPSTVLVFITHALGIADKGNCESTST